ncbi:HAD-IC family P-type ATPase [Streptomyces sp. ICC1]|uniref:HAD-IC family P-type ATPase n=1 Tax=Streptomyces sp. ICC1 TaxID=2099583 RepID=UPI0031BAE7B6
MRPSRRPDLRAVIGRGVVAEFEGDTVHIGSLAYADGLAGPPVPPALRDRTEELARTGRTTVLVRRGERRLGTLGLMDAPRPEAAGTVAALRALGVERTVMLSGDGQRVADAVGRAIGMDEVRGGLLPEDKVAEVARLRRTARTAMIGDGVNDAPAMAGATVGVAGLGIGPAVLVHEGSTLVVVSDALRLLRHRD